MDAIADFQYNLQQSECLNPRVHAREDGVYIKVCTCERLVCAQVNCIREHHAKWHRTDKIRQKEYCPQAGPLNVRRRLF